MKLKNGKKNSTMQGGSPSTYFFFLLYLEDFHSFSALSNTFEHRNSLLQSEVHKSS